MDHQGRFRRAAHESGIPDEEISGFLAYLRLSIGLSGGAGEVPAGQFGGLPRLPVGMDWPTAGDGPLPFVFSVDCAALPRVDGFGLPVDGSLLFFLDHGSDHLRDTIDQRRYGQVVHVPAGIGTEVREAPAGRRIAGERYDLVASLHAELPGWWETDEDEDDLSPVQEQLAEDLRRDLPHLDALRALAHDLWPPGEGLGSAELGGYPDGEMLTAIAEQVLAGRERAGEIVIPVAKWYSHVERETHRQAVEWLSLARFPIADEFYYSSFLIRHDDLAAGRLDRALSVTEFSE